MISLRMTQNEPLWLNLKRGSTRVSSTELASVFSMNRYKSKNELWREKSGKHKKQFYSAATDHGRRWEPVPIRHWMDEVFQEEDWEYVRPGTVLDPKEPVCCSPDMMFFHRRLDKVLGLEVKCPYSTGIPERKEDVPSNYLFQCFACLMITGADAWFLSYYDHKSDRLMSFEVAPDLPFWTETILPRVRQFLQSIPGDTSKAPFKRKGKEEKLLETQLRERLLSLTKEKEHLSTLGKFSEVYDTHQ